MKKIYSTHRSEIYFRIKQLPVSISRDEWSSVGMGKYFELEVGFDREKWNMMSAREDSSLGEWVHVFFRTPLIRMLYFYLCIFLLFIIYIHFFSFAYYDVPQRRARRDVCFDTKLKFYKQAEILQMSLAICFNN